jgi:hypothetical protein
MPKCGTAGGRAEAGMIFREVRYKPSKIAAKNGKIGT